MGMGSGDGRGVGRGGKNLHIVMQIRIYEILLAEDTTGMSGSDLILISSSPHATSAYLHCRTSAPPPQLLRTRGQRVK